MVILPIHQRDANRRAAEGFGAFQAGESGTEDDDVR
jgi:hypothetical protein